MDKSHKKVLLITRNYPPMIGGMESYSRDLYHALKSKMDIDIVKNNKGKLYLPFFLMYCIYFVLVNKNRYFHVHLADGVLAPLGYFIKRVANMKVSITIHALDITYNNKLFQWLVPFCLKKLDRVIGVSRFSIYCCVSRGIDSKQCTVISNGIDYSNFMMPKIKLEYIEKKYAIQLKGKKILLSVGRLIKRKGIEWFISEVIPKLPEEYIYLIVGEGPEKKAIKNKIYELHLTRKVYLLGHVDGEEKACLYDKAFLFIMPNIRVKGDAEGFGISIIEAASYGLPSIASNIEGISDAVVDGLTGSLIMERDKDDFYHKIINAHFDKQEIKKITKEKFDWQQLAERYHEIFMALS